MDISKIPVQRCNTLSTVDEIGEADILLIGIPLYGGRPLKFISPSNLLRTFSHLAESNLNEVESYTYILNIFDLGDITSSSYRHLAIDLPTIINLVNKEYEDKRYIFIGGDHTITYFTIKHMNIDTLVVLDAHLDLKDIYLHGRFNNATVLRRLKEAKNKLNILFYGVRGYDEEEISYVKKNDNICILRDVTDFDLYELGDTYISIDLDVFDSSLIRQVEYPEPNGITFNELITILKNISKNTKIKSMDLVEYLPTHIDRSEIALILRTLYSAAYYMQKVI